MPPGSLPDPVMTAPLHAPPHTTSKVPYLDVRERIAGRAAVALAWLLLFSFITWREYVGGDPIAGAVGFFAALAGVRLAWLLWWRTTRGIVLSIADDGLHLRGIGRIEWPDVVGMVVREERFKWKRMAFLDVCIRRPSRYGLGVSRASPGRDGFAVRHLSVTWIDAELDELAMRLRDARRRFGAPFADGWALDMTGPEIHAELDADEVLYELRSALPSQRPGDPIPERVVHALARAPAVMRAQTAAVASRVERQRTRLTAIMIVVAALTVIAILSRVVAKST